MAEDFIMEHQYRKIWLNINGVDRMIVCDPKNDSLADVLRRLGLTGTKIGCGVGVCGACSVILDGKVTRSCTKKMKGIEPFSKIITIEGIGAPMYLHPLQKAFMKFGALQCGICIPGFIVSAYQLLKENPDPTRQQVREWLAGTRNYCRCTGYKQITDAIMAAAAVMRGEADESTLEWRLEDEKKPEDELQYYNSHMPRPSALGKVTGTLDYGEDASLKMPEGMLHVAIVQPRVTRHANILKINTEEAKAMPGVVKVITGEDVLAMGGTNRLEQVPYNCPITEPTREILCSKKIKRFGDVIGLVVADTREHARAAAAKVTMEYEQLPEYLEISDALLPDAESIQTGFPNEYGGGFVLKGQEDARDIIADAPYSVEASMSVQHEPHLSIEGDILLSWEDEDGMLVVQSKSQAIYGNYGLISKSVGIPPEKLRIMEHGAVGASFGWSCDPTDGMLVAIAALQVHKPVSLVMTWEEHNHYAGKRTSAGCNARLSCDENGKISGLYYEMAANHGSYVEFSDKGNYFRVLTPYYVPNIRAYYKMFSSNNDHCTAWRGYGMPQVTTFAETLMDMLAEKYGMDPFEFRYQNLIGKDQESVNGSKFVNAEYMKTLYDMARPYYYEQLEVAKKLNEEETDGKTKYAVGISHALFFPTMGTWDSAKASVEIRKDGKIYVHNTYHEMGQGGDICNMVSTLQSLKNMGVKPEDIHIDINDSKFCPDSGISAQSRSWVMNTGAIDEACKLLEAAMKKEDGTYRTYDEMVKEGIPTLYEAHYGIRDDNKTTMMDYATGQGETSPTPGFAINICKVAVDTATGKTKVLSYHSWADCGVIGNYLGALGQAYGGIGQNVGYALTEDYKDSKKYSNIVSSGLSAITDVPDDMEVTFFEGDPLKGTPWGSHGLSEIFFAGQNAAILNGIYNATGVRIYEQPATPDKVKAGLKAVANGEPSPMPEPFFLDTDVDGKIDEAWEAYAAKLAAQVEIKGDEDLNEY